MRSRLSKLVIVALAFALSLGCSASRDSVAGWVRQQGGVLSADDQRQLRLEHVVNHLTGGDPSLLVYPHVLSTNSVSAYSWPNRQLFVTRGLIDRASDPELAAAVAHELGHLLDRRRPLTGTSALRGCDHLSGDAEARADAIGASILRSRGIPTQALVDLLKLVRASGQLPPQCDTAMAHRIELLHDENP